MKFRCRIQNGQLQEPEAGAFRAFVARRKDGDYGIEIKSLAEFRGEDRARVHIILRAIEEATGTPLEQIKAGVCRDLGWGEWKDVPWPGDGGEIIRRKFFVRRSTEEMNVEEYREFESRVRHLAAFCEVMV